MRICGMAEDQKRFLKQAEEAEANAEKTSWRLQRA